MAERSFGRLARFHLLLALAAVAAQAQPCAEWDAGAPIRLGVHMLEENGAASGWDPYSIAQEAQKLGSFYNSLHFSWHFTLTPEVGQPDIRGQGELHSSCSHHPENLMRCARKSTYLRTCKR